MSSTHRHLLFVCIFLCLLISSSWGASYCPVDGEIFLEYTKQCSTHNTKLLTLILPKNIHIRDTSGRELIQPFAGVTQNCKAYTSAGLKYEEEGIELIIPWKEVDYVLPSFGRAVRKKSGKINTFETALLKPDLCENTKFEKKEKASVSVLGQYSQKVVLSSISLKDVSLISFSQSGFEHGKRDLFNLEETMKKKKEDANKENAAILLIKARYMLLQKDTAAAQQLLNEARLLDPENSGIAELARSIEEEDEILRQKESRKKEAIANLLAKGSRAMTDGNPDEAVEAFRAVLKEDGHNVEAARLLNEATKLQERKKVSDLTERGQKALLAGNFVEAVSLFRGALNVEKNNPTVNSALTEALFLQEQKEKKELEELRLAGELVHVKGDCFEMGDVFGDGSETEKPKHRVCVNDFLIGRYEVTQRQWIEIMQRNPSRYNGCSNCPIENVSWFDVRDFIRRLNEKTGKTYRLPTEAEWEFAGRSGGKRTKWSGTSDQVGLVDFSWLDSKAGAMTHPVGQKKPNEIGLFDMTGNVAEWTDDWYDKDYYKRSPEQNPQGPDRGKYRIVRGGSWYSANWYARNSSRRWNDPSDRLGDLGFRLVRNP